MRITLDTTFNNDRIPSSPITVAAENFDYADGTSLIGKTTTVGGLVWAKSLVGTAADGDVKILGGAGGPTYATSSANRVFATVNLGRADGTTTAQFVGGVVGATLPFRFVDTSNYLYVTWVNPGIWALYKRVTGSASLVQSSSVAPTPSDLLEITHIGTAITVKINGAAAITTTVTDFTTATLGGIGGGVSGPATTPPNRWDNWKFTYQP